MHAADLSAIVLNELMERAGVDPDVVDDVIWGAVSQVVGTGEQYRPVVLAAEWPETVPGTSVNRACGSSQQAVSFAAAGVIAGHYDFAVAGGVESMSRVPMGSAAGWPACRMARSARALWGWTASIRASAPR